MFQTDPDYLNPHSTLNHLVPYGYTLALIPNRKQHKGELMMMRSSLESSDEFRMYEFKVKECPTRRAHDWTVCPFAHPRERARRRDPMRVGYVAVPCEEFRSSQKCSRGDQCEFAHGVFEYWLHPARYRTRACTSSPNCNRKVCFFAHSPAELRPQTRYTDPVRGRSLQVDTSNLLDYQLQAQDDAEIPDVQWIRDLIG